MRHTQANKNPKVAGVGEMNFFIFIYSSQVLLYFLELPTKLAAIQIQEATASFNLVHNEKGQISQ